MRKALNLSQVKWRNLCKIRSDGVKNMKHENAELLGMTVTSVKNVPVENQQIEHSSTTVIMTDGEQILAYQMLQKNLLLCQEMNPIKRSKTSKFKSSEKTKSIKKVVRKNINNCNGIAHLHDQIYARISLRSISRT